MTGALRSRHVPKRPSVPRYNFARGSIMRKTSYAVLALFAMLAHAQPPAATRQRSVAITIDDVPGVKCLVPGGAFYAGPNVTDACRMIGAADSEEFRKRLLNEAGVAVLADIHFGARVPGEGQHIRFSYAASKTAIEQGVARMAEFIRRNRRRVA